LAVVVDDHDMGITKVLRGADHLLNTFKQILIYRALEWSHPEFGHLPLILGPDKTRLSKRHGATSVEEFIKQGILPEAMFNYLCLLGWSPGDDSEMMDRREIVERFDQSRINKSAAVFDIKKLLWMNGKYLAQQSARILRSELNDWLMDQKYTLSADEEERFHFLIDLYKIRCNTFEELKQALTVYFKIPQEYDAKGLNKYFRQEQSVKLLKKFFTEVRASDEHVFDEIGQTEVFVRQWAEQQQIAAAKIIHPLRLALTGKMESPGIFELIYVLGKTKIEERIKKALEVIEKSQ
jgi:glutamyl/glutaminyl-tRNA synthetase